MAHPLDKSIREAFKTWASRNGVRPVRSSTEIGEARLICQRGLYSVEVVVPANAEKVRVMNDGRLPSDTSPLYVVGDGRLSGYEYPLLDKNPEEAIRFLTAE